MGIPYVIPDQMGIPYVIPDQMGFPTYFPVLINSLAISPC